MRNNIILWGTDGPLDSSRYLVLSDLFHYHECVSSRAYLPNCQAEPPLGNFPRWWVIDVSTLYSWDAIELSRGVPQALSERTPLSERLNRFRQSRETPFGPASIFPTLLVSLSTYYKRVGVIWSSLQSACLNWLQRHFHATST